MSYSDSAQKTASSGMLDIILINNFLSFEKFTWGPLREKLENQIAKNSLKRSRTDLT
jgi:hypothetical protein